MEHLLETGGDGYYEEKKSKFIAKAYPVSSQEEVDAILAAVRKQYYDARHNCYAYVIGKQGELVKSSDDGEPSGTAGKPILEIITGAQLSGCLIVVTRYFGGTLLGTGGLVRAYQSSAKDALVHSRILKVVSGTRLQLQVDYNSVGKIMRILEEHSVMTRDTIYAEAVTFLVEVPLEGEQALCKEIINQTAGKASIENLGDCQIKLPIEAEKI